MLFLNYYLKTDLSWCPPATDLPLISGFELFLAIGQEEVSFLPPCLRLSIELRPLPFFPISLVMVLPVFWLSGSSFPSLFLGGVSVWRRLFVSSQSRREKSVASAQMSGGK